MKFKEEYGFKFVEVCGFDFVKIGEAYLCDEPLKRKNGKPVIIGGKELKDWRLKLKLVVNENILNAGESVYLVFKKNDILYVGYYSKNFWHRWWGKQGYFWHGQVNSKVNELMLENESMKEKNDISVWLSVNPYKSVNPYEGEWNISKCIEDKIIIKHKGNGILLNKIGKDLEKVREATFTVQEILGIK